MKLLGKREDAGGSFFIVELTTKEFIDTWQGNKTTSEWGIDVDRWANQNGFDLTIRRIADGASHRYASVYASFYDWAKAVVTYCDMHGAKKATIAGPLRLTNVGVKRAELVYNALRSAMPEAQK